MAARLALLLVLAAWCHCEHNPDARPSGITSRRQLVEIVPVVRDGDAPSSASAPSLAYIVPARHLDPDQTGEIDDSSNQSIEMLKISGDLEDANEDREAERDADSDREAEMEMEESVDVKTNVAREGEEQLDEFGKSGREDGGQMGVRRWCAGRGGRAHILPAYTLSFVFGR